MLDENWSALISARPAALRDAVTALPPELVAEHPRLALAAEYLRRLTNDRTTTRFRGSALPARPVTLLDSLAQLTSRAAVARADGRIAEAVAAVEEARSLLDDSNSEARERLAQGLPDLQLQWGLVWEYAGDADRAIQEYIDCYDAALVSDNTMIGATAAASAAWIHALAGRGIQARNWIARVADDEGQWWYRRAVIPVLFAKALLLVDEFRFEEARAVLAEVNLREHPERWPFQKLLTAMTVIDPVVAFDVLAQIDTSSAGLPTRILHQGTTGAVVAIARSFLLATSGHAVEARATLMTPHADRSTLAGQILLCIRGASDARLGDYARAARTVSPLHGRSISAPRTTIAVLALLAAHELHGGDEQKAGERFAMAATLASSNRSFYALSILPAGDLEKLAALCPEALSAPVLATLQTLAPISDIDPFARLSNKERNVLETMLATNSVAVAAERLFVSTNTVKSQLRSIYKKTGVKSRKALSDLATRHGMHPGSR
jgi:DNA-binding CsgD family transcriptional regulator/tetratricopeptide (TPR) repeat protein